MGISTVEVKVKSKARLILRKILFGIIIMLIPGLTSAQFSFSDNATNYGGSWNNGSNFGTGYNAWTISSGGGNAGTFIGNPASNGMGTAGIGTTAFGLYGHSGVYVNATRYFGAGGTNVPMQIGDVFTFYWAMNWDCGASGSKGFDLRADGTTIFNVNNAGSATISTTNGNAFTAFGTNAMLVTLTRTSWTQYSFSMTARDGGASYNTTINSTSNINNINIYCGAQQDNNGNRNIFFNGFSFTKAAPYETNFDLTDTRVHSGSNGLTKTGTNILTLSGTNTYTGATTLTAGTLQLGAANVIADASNFTLNGGTMRTGAGVGFSETVGTLTVSANSTIALGTGAHTLTFANSSAASWAGSFLTITGWTGPNNGSGAGTAGRIFVGNSTSGLTSSQLSKIVFNISSVLYSAVQLSTGEIVASGATPLYYGGAAAAWNTANWSTNNAAPYTTAWTDGRHAIFNVASANLTGATVNFPYLTVNENATIATIGGTVGTAGQTSNIYVASGRTMNFAGQAFSTSGSYGIIKNGPGTVALSGATYGGGFTLNEGVVVALGVNAMGGNATPGPLTINGGTIAASSGTFMNFTGKYSVINVNADFILGSTVAPAGNRSIIFSSPTSLGNNVTRTITIGGLGQGGVNTHQWNGVISGTNSNLTIASSIASGYLTLNGANTFGGNLTLNAPSSQLDLGTTTQAYGGSTVITNGTLRTTIINALPSSSPVSIADNAGALFNLNGFNQTIASISGGGAAGGNITLGTATLTTNQSTNTTYSGIISESGGLAKSGTGTLTLAGANTYTGLTTINAGTLQLGAAERISNSSNMVLNGGTFRTGSGAGFSETVGTLNLTANSTITLGTGSHTITFANSSAVSWTAATTLTITGWSGTAGASGTAGRVFFGNAAGTLTAGQLAQISFSGYPGVPILLASGELVPPAGVASYTWNATTGSADWQTPASWTPTRNTPAATDVLNFTNGGSSIATNVPTETIAQFLVSNNTAITLQSASSGNTLTIAGNLGNDLSVPLGSTLTIGNGANALTLNYSGTGQVASIAGTLSISNGNTSNTYDATNSTTTVSGTINNGGIVTSNSTILTISGTYNHTHTSTPGAIARATWGSGSNMNITGYTTSTGQLLNMDQSFHHVTYNCASQTANSDLGLNNGTVTTDVNGNFTVTSTGSGRVRFNNSSTYFLTVFGNYIQNGGTVDFTGSGSANITFKGNVTLNAGTLDVKNVLAGGTSVTIGIEGNLSLTGGSLTKSSADSPGATINFNKASGVQTFNQSAATVTGSNNIAWNVNGASNTLQLTSNINLGTTVGNFIVTNGATLDFQTFTLSGSGAFLSFFGSTLTSANTNASGAFTTSGANGSVQLSGTRSYIAGTNFTLNGTAAQTTGNGIGQNAVGTLTISNTAAATPAVTLSNNASVTTLALSNGRIALGSNNLTVTGTTAASITGGASASFVQTNGTGQLRRSIATAGLPITYAFPVGTSTNYTPASYTFTTNSTARDLHVRAVAGIHPSMNSPVATTDYINNRYWTSDLSVTTGTYAYESNFTFLAGDVSGTLANVRLNRWDIAGSTWSQDNASSAAGTLLSSSAGQTQATLPLNNCEFAGRVNIVGPISYTWNGSVSNSWNTAGNWTPSGIPVSIDNITIPASASFTNQLNISGSQSINDFTVNATGTYTVSGTGALTINGNYTYSSATAPTFSCASALSIASASAQTIPAHNYGSLNLVGGPRTLAASGTIGICGNYTPSSGVTTTTGSAVNFNGTAAQSILTNAATFRNLTVSNTAANVTASTAVIVTNLLTINSSARLDMGTNALTVTGATSSINGFLRSGLASTTPITGASALTLTFNSGGTFECNAPMAAVALSGLGLPVATWSAGSTCAVIGLTSPTAGGWFGAGATQTFSNFTWNTTSLSTAPNMSGATITCTGTFTMQSTGSAELRLGTGTNGTINCGVFSQTGGTINFSAGTGLGTINCTGNFTQSAGLLTENSSGNGTVNFNGSSAQTINIASAANITNTINFRLNNAAGANLFGTTILPINNGATLFRTNGAFSGTGSIQYNGTNSRLEYDGATALTISTYEWPLSNGPATQVAISGGANITLGFSRTLNNVANYLLFSNGVLILGNFNIAATGANNIGNVGGFSATKMIATNGTGEVQYTVNTTVPTTYVFPIGDITGTTEYSPVSLTYSANSTSRTIGFRVVDAIHPSNNAPNTPAHYLSRYWVASNSVLSGTYTYNGTFTYAAADIVGTQASIQLNMYDGSNWTQAASSAAANVLTITGTVNQSTLPIGATSEFTGRVNAAVYFQTVGSGNWAGSSTTLLTENFNANNPAWTKTNNSTGGTPANAAWTNRVNNYNSGSATFTTSDATGFILSDANAQGAGGTTNTILTSPSFSTVGYTAANIIINHHFAQPSDPTGAGFVEASTDGTTWTTLTSYSAELGLENAFINSTIPLTSAFLNTSTVYIRFRFFDVFGFWWAINNVTVSGNNPASTWETSTDPAFLAPAGTPATVAPNNINSLGITVRNGHTVTVNTAVTADDLTIASGGILTVANPGAFTLNNGAAATDFTINGTFNVNSTTTISSGAAVTNNANWNTTVNTLTTTGSSITQNASAVYDNAFDGGTIPASTWNSGSTLKITGIVSSSSIGGMNQTFHHLIYECIGQTITSVNLTGAITGINGNLTVNNTGGTTRELRLFSNNVNTNTSLTIAGDVIMNGGKLAVTNSSSTNTANPILNISGNLTLNGSSIFDLTGNSANTAAGSTVNLSGNLTINGTATLVRTQATPSTFRFNKSSGIQTFTAAAPTSAVSAGAIVWQVGNGTTTPEVVLSNDFVMNASSSFTVNTGAILDVGTQIIRGTTAGTNGSFTLNSGSTLKTANTAGIVAALGATTGSIQTGTAKTFDGGASYVYKGTANQVTGTGLPLTLVSPGQLTIANTGGAGNNTVTLTTNNTVTPTVNLQSGVFAIGTGNTLNISNNGSVAVTSGDFANGSTGGTLNGQGAVTFSGNSNPYNVYASGGINFGAGTVTIQNGGAFRINAGGFVNTNAPFYASGSTLEYNTGGNYDRGFEWSAAAGRGYPHHVTLLNTTLNPAKTGGAYASTAFNTGGNLTINSGANIYMNFGGNNMAVPLTINGNLTLIGNLSGSQSVGGDIRIRGNWINNGSGANYFPNTRAVFFDGSTAQTLGGSNATINPFAFFILDNFNGLTLLSSQQVNNDFTFINGQVILGNFNFTMSTLNAAINGVTAANYFVTNGNGQLYRNFNNTNTIFPIGPSTTAYNPITLNQAGTIDNIGARVKATPPFGAAVNDANEMIKVEYYLSESVAGGNNLFTGLQWNLIDEGSAFNRNSGVYHGMWNGSAWQVRASNPTLGSNPYFSNSTANYTGNLSNTLFAFGNINGFFPCLQTANAGDWNTGSTWNGGAVPSTDANVCLLHNVTVSTADATISNVTINTGGTLNIGAAYNLDILTLGSVVNNSGSTANLGSGTVRFLGTGAFSGTSGITATNIQLNGNTTFSSSIATTVTGNLTMNSGSFITSGSPTYSATSTLVYNTGGSYNVNTEWNGNSTTAGLGIPQNVTIQNATTLNMPAGNRGLAGNLNISNGTLALNGTSGDLYVGGNWNRVVTAGFTSNNRAVFFNGAANQTITVNGGGTESFAYLLVTKTGGSLILDNATNTDVNVTASTGNVLQINSGNTLDLNGRTFALTGTSGNFNIPSGAVSITGASGSVFSITGGTKTVTPGAGATLNFGSNVRVALNNGLNFGANTSTIQGILQIANGGFVSTNAPTYATGSTLRYFTGGNFNRSTEWSAISGPGYPHNVEVIQNGTVTTLDVSTGSSPVQIAGNLTVNTGGIVTLNNRSTPLIVKENVSVGSGASGTLVLSSVVGGDIQIAGNLSRIDAGVITQNGREIEMNGTTPQTIGGISSFEFLKINNSGSNVIIGAPITINNRLSLVSGTFIQNSYSVTMANGSKIMRSGGFMLEPPVVVGTDQYDMEYQASVTTDVEYLGNEEIRDLIIGSGITVTLQSNKTFNRNLDLAGDLNLGTSTLTARGKATNPSFSGSINLTGGGTRLITGSAGCRFNITGLGLNTPLAYTKTFSSFGGTLLNFDSNVLVRIGDGAVDFGTGNPVTINGVLQVVLGGSVGQSLNSCFYGTNSTLRFANTVDYQVGATDKTWAPGAINSGLPGIPWNVEVNDGGTDLTLNDTRALRGNLTITSGTFTLSTTYTGSFNIGGNWTRSGATSAFNNAFNKKVVFDRQIAGDQIITTSSGVLSERFYDLEVSPFGGNVTLGASTALEVINNLNFVSGKLDLSNNQLTVGNNTANGSITGGNASSYIATTGTGNVKRFSNSNVAYDFPIGDLANYSPMKITLDIGAQAGAFLTVSVSPVIHPQSTPTVTEYIKRYWRVVPSGLTSGPRYDVEYSYVDGDIVVNEASLRPVKFSTATATTGWVSAPGFPGSLAYDGASASFNQSLNTFKWDSLSTFSDFTAFGNGTPLPIELLSFDAQPVGNTVLVNWTTASEINNDYFTIERSSDALSYTVIGTVDGAGNSNSNLSYQFIDAQPLQGVSYYRLRQTDFNGTTEVFDPAVVNFNAASAQGVSMFPNPAVDYAHVMLQSEASGNGYIRITDLSGRIVFEQNVSIKSGVQPFTLETRSLSLGTYLVTVSMADGRIYTLPLVKN